MTALDDEYGVQVTGRPAPKGSMTCVGQRGKRKHVLVEDNADTAPWRARVELAGRKFPVAGLDGPVGVEVTVTIERPPSHYRRTSGGAHLLKADAPAWPHRSHGKYGGNGDADKYARNILDGLADAGLYGNDIQVVELTSRKCYPDTPCPDRLPRPGAVIRIYPLEEC